MTSNINLNLNQSPYFDDYDETKDFHQVLYKPAVAVQARDLSQEQTILRNQVKRFGHHIFANGSRVSGGELHIDAEYEYVKLQATYNNANITTSLLSGKTIVGNTSGTSAKVVNYTVVDDFGSVINPLVVEGQVYGGIAQGIGQALYENGHYDESGQLTSASYMDYTMPRADNFPQIKLDYTCTPATSNPLGAKGCGEAGTIASPPAVMNAVIDAIGTDISMPATAEKVWKALKKNASKNAAA